VATNSDLYAKLNLAARNSEAIQLDSTYSGEGDIVDFAYSFKIKALAEGGHFVYRYMEARLVVCGYEVVTVVDSSELAIVQ